MRRISLVVCILALVACAEEGPVAVSTTDETTVANLVGSGEDEEAPNSGGHDGGGTTPSGGNASGPGTGNDGKPPDPGGAESDPPPPWDGPIPGLSASSLYGVYYGNWDTTLINKVTGVTGKHRYDLIILHPNTNVTPQHVAALQQAGALVFCYLTVGEEDYLHTKAASGGVAGPGGYASWYYDADHDNLPDQNPDWDSYYTNPSDPYWREALRTYRKQGDQQWYGYEYDLYTLGCNGLFLDTVGTVGPAEWDEPYAAEMDDMIDLIEGIRANIPSDRYLIMNRGLFYFDPYDPVTNPEGLVEVTAAMRDRVRNVVNGVMFENFMDEPADERTYWGSRLDAEGDTPDGFTILSLDYVADPAKTTTAQVKVICNATRGTYGWLPHVSTIDLDTFVHRVRDDCY